jgi:lipoprotein-anchoring transpeptidase ErfK/SrfK
VPDYVGLGPQKPMGARLGLFASNKDILYRIYGTNQPVRRFSRDGMTNEDAIDVCKRAKSGTW